jgi:inosine-uridine nucleoside N-ribohydrolase
MRIRRVSRAIAVSLVGIWIAAFAGGKLASAKPPVPIIFDTDIGTDVDNAGALAILHILADRGEAKILATISANQSRSSAPAIDVINTYYGRGDIPIGSSKTGPDDEKWYRDFVPKFPHDLADGNNAPDAVTLYRKILAAQPDHSVTIVVVGWLTNMADLLNSPPDDYSPLDGKQLVAAKVRELVAMGGTWPNIKKEGEYNFHMDGAAAHKVIRDWPGKIMFTGLGKDVMTGARLMARQSNDHPVRAFYSKFLKAYKVSARSSWDQIAVLYAVRGPSDNFTVVTDGQCVSQEDGSNRWVSGPAKNHGYLVYKMPQEKLAAVIEDLMLTPPGVTLLIPDSTRLSPSRRALLPRRPWR